MKPRTQTILALLLGIVLTVLYVYDIGRYGYWEDEIYTARDIGLSHSEDSTPEFRLSFSELTYRNDNHPPFYFWLLAQWVRLFGFSEYSGRLFSLLFFGLALAVLVRFSTRWKEESSSAPLWTLLIFGVCSSSFVMTREARMYTLAFFLVCVSLFLFVDLYADAGKGRLNRPALAGLILVNTLGLYTHYYFLFFYGAEALLAGWVLLRRRAWSLAGALAVSALLFLPWIPQLERQRERKYESGLWVIGPHDERSYLRMMWEEGTGALWRLLFGSIFQSATLLAIILVAVLVYLFLRKRRVVAAGYEGLLLWLGVLPYAALLANDLYHHTITATRTKYLFFLVPALLLLFLRVAIFNLPAIRFCLLALFLAYNLTGVGRERLIQPHPDWRAIARQAEFCTRGRPLLVRDDDYFLCLNYYYHRHSQTLVNEEWLSVYPEDFWLLAVYLPWKPEIQQKLRDMTAGFDEVERIDVDRFSTLIHFRFRAPGQATSPKPL